jgi:hypothetical protein
MGQYKTSRFGVVLCDEIARLIRRNRSNRILLFKLCFSLFESCFDIIRSFFECFLDLLFNVLFWILAWFMYLRK